MAGWTCKDREVIEWDGTIKSNRFLGDGSGLTNLPAGSEVDPIFKAQSGAFLTSYTESDPIFKAQSGAFLTSFTEADPIFLVASAGLLRTGLVNNVSELINDAGYGAGGGVNLWASDAICIFPVTTSLIVSGAGFKTNGDISGAYYYGDGSKLQNLPAGGEVDPVFKAQSGAFAYNTPYQVTSGCCIQTSGSLVGLSAAYYLSTGNMYQRTSGAFLDLSGALYLRSRNQYQVTSGCCIQTSAALVSLTSNYTQTSGGVVGLSGALNNLSGAYYAHASDSSDPHGATLTQTIISIASGAVTGDMGASGSLYIPGILYNTTSGGITVANYPIGSLLMVYTP